MEIFVSEMYGVEKGVPATFQIIYFIGWKPDPSQVRAGLHMEVFMCHFRDLYIMCTLINS